MAIRGTNLIPLPDNVTYEEGALLEALGVAINAVDRVNPQMGDCAVVLGCGAIGLLMLKVWPWLKRWEPSPLTVKNATRWSA